MQIVSVKFTDDVLKKIDKGISKHNFNSRTEFIREAVRDKLQNLSKDELIAEFMKFHGKGKPTTDAHRRRVREEVGREIMAKYGIK